MSYRRTFLLMAALSLGLGAAAMVRADSVPAHHGGQVQDAGPYHLELVAKPNELTVYVLGSGGKAVDTKGATGSATVLSRKARETVSLAPAGGNVIKGSGKFEIGADTKIAVSLTFAGQQPVQARFAPGEGGHVGGHK
ncbi:MAG: hypothetical protein HYU77_15565 [Betaproteobacteria bacterium]|nr:hypothetical protein [Betaproteobacteria bacterium]